MSDGRRRPSPETALLAGTAAGAAVLVVFGVVAVVAGGPGSAAYAGFALAALAASLVFCAVVARAGTGGLLTGLAAVTLALLLGSAAIPRAVGSEREHEARFGYPVPFVATQLRHDPPSYPITVALDPWEDVTRVSPARFAASFALVYLPLLALAALLTPRREA